jgi:hypothetical protein
MHMPRVQVTFSDEDMRYLSARATASGQPVSAVVRQAVEQDRVRDEQHRRREAALSVIGKYRSDLDDGAESHDESFVRAIEERIGRR